MKHVLRVIVAASAILVAYSQESAAALADFSGTGRIKTAADYISLSLSVHSDCQPSPTDAQVATDKVTAKIDAFLQHLKPKDAKHFKVLIDGGFSMPYSRWSPMSQQQQMGKQIIDRETCRNTFQKVTNITLRLDIIDNFHRVFARIQNYVLKNFEQLSVNSDDEVPRVYVTMATPFPEITPEHRADMEKQALDLAVRNAKSNFKAAVTSCQSLSPWTIHSIKESGSIDNFRPMRSYAAAAPKFAADVSNENAPVRFDDIEVTRTVAVSFKFYGDGCYEK